MHHFARRAIKISHDYSAEALMQMEKNSSWRATSFRITTTTTSFPNFSPKKYVNVLYAAGILYSPDSREVSLKVINLCRDF